MPNKYFNVSNPQQIITIVEDQDRFYKLSDGNMIKKDTFMQKYQPVLDDVSESVKTQPKHTQGEIDPDTFFKSTVIPDNVVNGIKQADPTKASDNVKSQVVHKGTGQSKESAYNESLVKRIDDPLIPNIPNNTNTDVSQYKVYDNDDDAYADFEKKNQGQQPPKPKQTDYEKQKMEIELLFDDEKMAFGEEEAISRRSKRLLKLPTAKPQQELGDVPSVDAYNPPTPQPAISPIEMMFSTFKRKHPITVNVEFTDMIGEPDFVKLMVENMDGDIVGYYKKKVMENIMKDLSKIELAVEATIKSEIFGDEDLTEDEQLIKNFEKNKDGLKDLVKRTLEPTEPTLIPGGTTKTGKQKYKYVDENGNVKELLPETAKTKGYEAYHNF